MSELPAARPRPDRRLPIAVTVGALIVVLIGVVIVLLVPKTDRHTRAACAAVDKNARAVTLEEAIGSELTAITQAQKSGDAGLRKAGNTVSVATTLPADSPLYENPGDLRFDAVKAWCARR